MRVLFITDYKFMHKGEFLNFFNPTDDHRGNEQ